MSNEKTIYISYDDADFDFVKKLDEFLQVLLQGQVHVNKYDLRGGEIELSAIESVIAQSKWFILILSQQSINSKAIERDARLSKFRLFEQNDFNIMGIKLDKCEIPRSLAYQFQPHNIIDLSEMNDTEKENELYRIVNYINKESPMSSKKSVFVDRGDIGDRFENISREKRIISIQSIGGMGKNSFIVHEVSRRLKKQPLTVEFRKSEGFSIDFFAREIIRKAHFKQPVPDANDTILVNEAINALKSRERTHFLHVRGAELLLGISNEILSHIVIFLEQFLRSEVRSHIVLSTTRVIKFANQIIDFCDVLHLNPLEDIYIKQMIDDLLAGHDKQAEYMNAPEMLDLIKATSGHPLAAVTFTMALKSGKPPRQIIHQKNLKRETLRLVSNILNKEIQNALSPVQTAILQFLAIASQPLSYDDLFSSREIRQYSNEDVEDAIDQLHDLLLIEQSTEGLLSLHTFIAMFYRDQLRHDSDRQKKFEQDLCEHSHKKTLALNDDLQDMVSKGGYESLEQVPDLSGEVFRYAVTANRFLRVLGREDEANRLPIKIRSTLREMVLYFYQEREEYETALKYAEKWLSIKPDDHEIELYKARCYRNLGKRENLAKAEIIIASLENTTRGNRFFSDRITNEKGRIALKRGEDQIARDIFERAIEHGSELPDTLVNLASIYIRQANILAEYDGERKSYGKKAAELISEAMRRSRYANESYGQHYLDLYIDALNLIDDETAFPLLETALEERPRDPFLNHRMAELLRQKNNFDEAEIYAQSAIKYGSTSGLLSLANILLGQSLKDRHTDEDKSTLKLNKAIMLIKEYRNKPNSKEVVADCLESKILRSRGNLDDVDTAGRLMAKHENSSDPYVIYELVHIAHRRATQLLAQNNHSEALAKARAGKTYLDRLPNNRNSALLEVENQLEDIINRFGG